MISCYALILPDSTRSANCFRPTARNDRKRPRCPLEPNRFATDGTWIPPSMLLPAPGCCGKVKARAGECLTPNMIPSFFDTHAHLDFPDFAQDLAEVLTRAEAAGVRRIITIGTDLPSSARAVELAERHPQIFAVVGWHPSHASEAPSDIREPLRALAVHPKVVAIGETGLDYCRLPSKHGEGSVEDDLRHKEKQAALFEQQLEIAAETGLNCVVHQREAFQPVLDQMRPFAGRLRGVFHCFVNDVAEMRQVLALGCLVSFTGILTFKSAANVRATLAETPRDQFMLETDCPYLAPVPYRGKRCEPAHVRDTATVAAQVKGLSLEELSESTCATARRFFPKLT